MILLHFLDTGSKSKKMTNDKNSQTKQLSTKKQESGDACVSGDLPDRQRFEEKLHKKIPKN